MYIQIQLTLITICVHVINSCKEPLVKLPNGHILGRESLTFRNNSYFAFKGIPYAAPPVGQLRFKAPQPPKSWDGVLDTTSFQVACYQFLNYTGIRQSDDCLYLSIFTPRLFNNNSELLPVMLYIHGGGFTTKNGFLYSPDFFVDNEVVLVAINYRLGVFGFLSTQDDVIPGNNGLKDQLLAIKWTNDNIRLFGGDPDKITIFGESAGSASVAYQLLNQNSEGLFRGAILESGTFLGPWALQRNARRIAYGTAALLDPTINETVDTLSLLKFLQSVDASKLNEAAELYTNLTTHIWNNVALQGLTWAPVMETDHPGAFVTKNMYDQLKAGNILKVPVMIGINSEENIYFNPDPEVAQEIMPYLDRDLGLLVPDDMQITDFRNRTEMGRLIREIYTGGKNFTDNIGAGIRYASDNYFTRSVIKHAELYSKLADTYFYEFSYDGPMGGISTQYDGAEKVAHTEELHYLFCLDTSCNVDTFSESDFLTRKRLVKLWTNFGKYLNPTPKRSELFEGIIWPKLSTKNGNFFYLDIGNKIRIKNHPKKEVYNKWINLYKTLQIDSFDTY